MKSRISLLSVLVLTTFFFGCTTPTHKSVFGDAQSAIQLRSIQGRVFATEDLNRVLRAAVATLQDFGFIVEQANEYVGVISGTAFPSGARINVYAFQKDKNTVVRVNVQHELQAVKDPIVYQRFFNALSQSLFLAANLEYPDEAFIALQNDIARKPSNSKSRTKSTIKRNTADSVVEPVMTEPTVSNITNITENPKSDSQKDTSHDTLSTETHTKESGLPMRQTGRRRTVQMNEP